MTAASRFNTSRVLRHLRSRGYEHPLTELRFATEGKEIFFQHRDGSWEGGRRRDQIVLEEVLHLEPLRQRIRTAVEAPRAKSKQGQIERRRKVLGSKEVFAGTRVPVSAVWTYLDRGCSTRDILEAFPQLSTADVLAAREAMGAA